jgi:uncharacterized membrane protein YfcA
MQTEVKNKPIMTAQIIMMIILIGLSAGILSGLVGVGGGIILVPAMIYFLNYTQHQAQGTSLGVLTFPVVLIAFVTYYRNCKTMGVPIDFKVIAILAIGFVVGAYFGSNIAVRIDREMLRKIFAVILFYTAINMMGWDKALIRWIKSW